MAKYAGPMREVIRMHAARFAARLWLWRRLILVSALAASAVVLISTDHDEVGIAVAFAALVYVATRASVAAIQRGNDGGPVRGEETGPPTHTEDLSRGEIPRPYQ